MLELIITNQLKNVCDERTTDIRSDFQPGQSNDASRFSHNF